MEEEQSDHETSSPETSGRSTSEYHESADESKSEVKNTFPEWLFPFSEPFSRKTRKEKEIYFMRLFEDKTEAIRTKELRCSKTDAQPLLPETDIFSLQSQRQSYFIQQTTAELDQINSRKQTTSSTESAPRVDVVYETTFSTLLNTTFNFRFTLINEFKKALTEKAFKLRVSSRIQKIKTHLLNNDVLSQVSVKATTVTTLLACPVNVEKTFPSFWVAKPALEVEFPEPLIEPHKIQKEFSLYAPGLVERYRFSDFSRTETTTFLAVPISAPEKFPTVLEEQPIREGESQMPSVVELPKKVEMKMLLPKVIHFQREIRDHQEFLNPTGLEDIPDEVGQSSILAMTVENYTPLFLSKSNVAFTFSGIKKVSLPLLDGPLESDLRELLVDDQLDTVDITPKPKAVTEFLPNSLATKNRSQEVVESAADAQAKWKNKMKDGANLVIDKASDIAKLLNDQSLKLKVDDLFEITRK